MSRLRRAGAWAALLLLAGLLPALTAAAETADQRMGDSALRQNDPRNAVRFFENMLQRAEETHNETLWTTAALRLGSARLAAGDVNGAKTILAEYRRRFPALSAGTLPGEIFLAEKRYAEAETFFTRLAKSPDPEEAAAARFRLGEMLLRSGKYAEAEKHFGELARSAPPLWRRRAAYEKIYCMIRKKKSAEAASQLKKISEADRLPCHTEMELMAALSGGSLTEFRTVWPRLRAGLLPEPDARRCEMLQLAATLAGAGKDYDLGVRCLNDALEFAPEAPDRRNVLRKLFALQAEQSPAAAADSIEHRLTEFPPGEERAELCLLAGRLCIRAGNVPKALDFYRRILQMNGVPLTLRFRAASEGAAGAESASRTADAKEFYHFLTENAPSRSERYSQFCAYGEFLLRTGDGAGAEDAFRNAARAADRKQLSHARYGLLRAALLQKKDKEAQKIAGQLASADAPEEAAFARYQLACLAERGGQLVEARRLYEAFLKGSGGAAFRPAAFFARAELALRLRLYPDALREFLEFTRQYPRAKEAPGALFSALRAARLAKDPVGEKNCFDLLCTRYADSRERIVAALQAAEQLSLRGEADKALELLNNIPKANLTVEVSLERALILQRARRLQEAMEEIRRLLTAHPGAPAAADAALLGGTILFDQGRYDEALQSYARAAELRPTGLFGDVVRGRMCDCALVLYGAGNHAELEKSAGVCAELAQKSLYPEIRLQSLYKLGRFRELLDDREGAESAYEQVIYYAAEMQSRKLTPAPEWCVRAVHAALALYEDHVADVRRALRLIARYEALKLPGTGENYQLLRNRIRKRK